jgi:hypothetical protein
MDAIIMLTLISYLVVCGLMVIGIVVGIILKFLERVFE